MLYLKWHILLGKQLLKAHQSTGHDVQSAAAFQAIHVIETWHIGQPIHGARKLSSAMAGHGLHGHGSVGRHVHPVNSIFHALLQLLETVEVGKSYKLAMCAWSWSAQYLKISSQPIFDAH